MIGRIADLVVVPNTDRKFGSAEEYYAIRMQLPDGTEKTGLFTWHEIYHSFERADKNPEDVPTPTSIIDKIRDGLD